MPSILDLVSLFGIPTASQSHPADRTEDPQNDGHAGGKGVRAHGIRLLQLTDRDSSVMTVSQVDEYSQLDPVVNIFRTLGQLLKIAVSGEVAVMPETRFAEALVSKSSAISSDLVLIPWDKTGTSGATQSIAEAVNVHKLDPSYTNIIRPILQNTESNIGVFFPKAISTHSGMHTPQRVKLTRAYSLSDIKSDIPIIPVTSLSHHIFLAYFGGRDDELALTVVLQLCEKPDVTATAVRFAPPSSSSSSSSSDRDSYFASAAASSLGSSDERASRVKFETVVADDGYEAALERAATEMQPESREVSSRKLIVLGRRAGAEAVGGKPSYRVVEEVREGLGAVGAHLVASGLVVDLLVVQAKA